MSLAAIASTLYPPQGAPYYIVSPPYRRSSAGVRVLHLLCNALNRAGQKAYIVLNSEAAPGVHPVHPRLMTPLLTNQEKGFWRTEGVEPIAIYPEIISDNPLGAKHVVRYLLYFAGARGGQRHFPQSDMIVSYTEVIRKHYGSGTLLTLPTSDPAVFHPPIEPIERKGMCFYAARHKSLGGALLEMTGGGTEITKDYPVSVQDLAALLRRSEMFFTYDDTALALEAALCGCPVVQLSRKAQPDEFGHDGVAFGTDPDDIARAKASVHKVHENYQKVILRFQSQLEAFIERTQRWPY